MYLAFTQMFQMRSSSVKKFSLNFMRVKVELKAVEKIALWRFLLWRRAPHGICICLFSTFGRGNAGLNAFPFPISRDAPENECLLLMYILKLLDACDYGKGW